MVGSTIKNPFAGRRLSPYKIISVLSVLLILSFLHNLRSLFFPSSSSSNPSTPSIPSNPSPSLPLTHIERVVDGDTFIGSDGTRYRLLGIDTPELDRCLGKEAKDRLTSLIEGRDVQLEEIRPSDFGRKGVSVRLDDIIINEVLAREGLGKLNYDKSTYRENLKEANKLAQAEKLGWYSGICTSNIPPDSTCVIKGNVEANSSKKFYHLPSCNQYKSVILDTGYKDEWLCSEKEAIQKGYLKAGGC